MEVTGREEGRVGREWRGGGEAREGEVGGKEWEGRSGRGGVGGRSGDGKGVESGRGK